MTQPDPQGARAALIAFEGPDNPVDLARINALIDAIEAEAIAANNAALAERVRGLADVRVWNEWTDAFDDHDELVDRAAVLDLLVPTVTTDPLSPSGDL